MKSNDFLNEDLVTDAQHMQLDHEVQMARKDCYQAAENAIALHKLLRNISEQQGLEGWVSAKITLASDYLNTVREHLEYQLMSGAATGDEVPVDTMATPMINNVLPVAEGAQLKQVKKKYNQAAKDANADKVGAGKKIDTMKKSLRQKDIKHISEMDKSQTPPGRDGGDSDAGKKQYYGKVAKPGDVVKKGVKALDKAFNDEDKKKNVKEGKVKELSANLRDKTMSSDEFKKKYGKTRAEVRAEMKKKPDDKVNETSSGGVATVVNPTPKNKAKVGSLFGGTYKQPAKAK